MVTQVVFFKNKTKDKLDEDLSAFIIIKHNLIASQVSHYRNMNVSHPLVIIKADKSQFYFPDKKVFHFYLACSYAMNQHFVS